MSNIKHTDDALIQKIEDLLERDRSSDLPIANDLKDTLPRADAGFQQSLEDRLVAQLRSQRVETKEEIYTQTPPTLAPTRPLAFSLMTWAAVLTVAMFGLYALALYQTRLTETAPIAISSSTHTVVVAVRDMRDGVPFTDNLLGTVTFSDADFASLQQRYPGEIFFTDPQQVVGKSASIAIRAFDPLSMSMLGLSPLRCASVSLGCIPTPDGYRDINLPLPDISPLEPVVVGDHVDVMENSIAAIVRNALLVDVQRDYVTLAVPPWKYGILTAFVKKGSPYIFRLYQEDHPENWNDTTLVEYTIRTLAHLKTKDGLLGVAVQFPISEVPADGPDSLDLVESGANEDTVWFYFSDVILVRAVNDSTYVIRLPQYNANNLDYLLNMQGELTFFIYEDSQDVVTPTPIPTVPTQHRLVIAMKNIRPGDTITEDMIGVSMLSADDFADLQASRPERELFDDPSRVIGKVSVMSIRAFEPLGPLNFQLSSQICPQHVSECLLIPDGDSMINLPVPKGRARTLITGDRVDLLINTDGQDELLVEDVLLFDQQDTQVTLAASGWKHAVIVWTFAQKRDYSLRLHQDRVVAKQDHTRIDHTIIVPETIPADRQFDMIVSLHSSKGPELINSPYSLDDIPFTQSGDILNFWFKDQEFVSVTDQTMVLLRISRSDAANLDYLISIGATISFVPDEG